MDANTNGSGTISPTFTDLINNQVLEVFVYVDFIVIFSAISLAGIIANVINTITFVKMDLKDTVNISLLGLSFSDLCFLILTLLLSLSYYPFWKASYLGFQISDIRYLVIGWPHFYFKRVSNWIMAYLMFERCLCITLPFKVHNIVNPKRTRVVIFAIYGIMVSAVFPIYMAASYQFQFDILVNKTSLVLIFNNQRDLMDAVATGISFALTVLTFIWVISCALFMVFSLKRNSAWRTMTAGVDKSKAVSSRDRRVIKMVVLLSIVFLVAFIPESAALIAQATEPRLSFGGQYNNVLLVILGFSETLLAINASINTVIYWHMSSKYREIFGLYFCKLDGDH